MFDLCEVRRLAHYVSKQDSHSVYNFNYRLPFDRVWSRQQTGKAGDMSREPLRLEAAFQCLPLHHSTFLVSERGGFASFAMTMKNYVVLRVKYCHTSCSRCVQRAWRDQTRPEHGRDYGIMQ